MRYAACIFKSEETIWVGMDKIIYDDQSKCIEDALLHADEPVNIIIYEITPRYNHPLFPYYYKGIKRFEAHNKSNLEEKPYLAIGDYRNDD